MDGENNVTMRDGDGKIEELEAFLNHDVEFFCENGFDNVQLNSYWSSTSSTTYGTYNAFQVFKGCWCSSALSFSKPSGFIMSIIPCMGKS